MKRYSYLFVFLLLLVLLSGCGSAGIQSLGKQGLVTPTAAPTNTPVPEKAKEKSYYDDFSNANASWSELVTVTTQSQPGTMKTNPVINNGKMQFVFLDKETYLYKFYTNPTDADVVLETKVQGAGALENGMALVCRSKNDYSTWYEARVSSLSQYTIYRYDKSLRDSGGNPYISLQKGGLQIDMFGPTKENVVRFTCKGSSLKLEVNNKTIATVEDGTLKDGGLAGLGAMSGTLMPVDIRFDYFSYGQP
jgi:hypothetical protein